MNLEGALALIRKALSLEASESVQTKLEAVRDRLDYMINQPAEPSYQTGFVSDLKELRDALRQIERMLTPA